MLGIQGAQHISSIDEPPPATKPLRATLHKLTFPMHVLAPVQAQHGTLFNPSVVVHDNKLLTTIRVYTNDDRRSNNVIGEIDDRWQITNVHLIEDWVNVGFVVNAISHGYEDCRLFVWNEKLCASATICDRLAHDLLPKMTVMEFNGIRYVMHSYILASSRFEKNWMPVVLNEVLKFVYTVDPLVVVTYDPVHRTVSPTIADIAYHQGNIRGGSQLIPYQNGYISVVHKVYGRQYQYYVYQHHIAYFNKDLTTVKLGKPFHFTKIGIEFCAGLAKWQDKFIFSFGVDDQHAMLAVTDESTINEMLKCA